MGTVVRPMYCGEFVLWDFFIVMKPWQVFFYVSLLRVIDSLYKDSLQIIDLTSIVLRVRILWRSGGQRCCLPDIIGYSDTWLSDVDLFSKASCWFRVSFLPIYIFFRVGIFKDFNNLKFDINSSELTYQVLYVGLIWEDPCNKLFHSLKNLREIIFFSSTKHNDAKRLWGDKDYYWSGVFEYCVMHFIK